MDNKSTLRHLAIGMLLCLAGGCSDTTFQFRERSPIAEDGSTENSPKSVDAETAARSENPDSEPPLAGEAEESQESQENCSLEPYHRETLDQVPKIPCPDSDVEVDSPNQSE